MANSPPAVRSCPRVSYRRPIRPHLAPRNPEPLPKTESNYIANNVNHNYVVSWYWPILDSPLSGACKTVSAPSASRWQTTVLARVSLETALVHGSVLARHRRDYSIRLGVRWEYGQLQRTSTVGIHDPPNRSGCLWLRCCWKICTEFPSRTCSANFWWLIWPYCRHERLIVRWYRWKPLLLRASWIRPDDLVTENFQIWNMDFRDYSQLKLIWNWWIDSPEYRSKWINSSQMIHHGFQVQLSRHRQICFTIEIRLIQRHRFLFHLVEQVLAVRFHNKYLKI